MGKCKFCGQEAGLLRSVHKDCEAKHNEGMIDICVFLQKAAQGSIDLGLADSEARKMAAECFISPVDFDALLFAAYDNAISSFLNDDLLSRDEETFLAQYKGYFELSMDTLSESATYGTMVKAAILRDVSEGNFNSRVHINGEVPFVFQKSETLLWLFADAEYYQPRTKTTYQGQSSGASIRVTKGVYYRLGEFRGNPIASTQMTLLDSGMVAITDKHIYFAGDLKSLRVKFDKIISISPYSDGIAIQRDSVTRLDAFMTGDGWFTYNLVTMLAKA